MEAAPLTCPANMPNKQAAALTTIEPLGQRNNHLEKAFNTGLCPAKHADSR